MNQIRGTVYCNHPHISPPPPCTPDKQRQPGSQLRNLAPITQDWQSQGDHPAMLHTHTPACPHTHIYSNPGFIQLITHTHNNSYLQDTEPSLSLHRSMYVNLCNNVCTNGLLPCVSWFALISMPEGDGETRAVCCSYVPSRTIITFQLVSIKDKH